LIKFDTILHKFDESSDGTVPRTLKSRCARISIPPVYNAYAIAHFNETADECGPIYEESADLRAAAAAAAAALISDAAVG